MQRQGHQTSLIKNYLNRQISSYTPGISIIKYQLPITLSNVK